MYKIFTAVILLFCICLGQNAVRFEFVPVYKGTGIMRMANMDILLLTSDKYYIVGIGGIGEWSRSEEDGIYGYIGWQNYIVEEFNWGIYYKYNYGIGYLLEREKGFVLQNYGIGIEYWNVGLSGGYMSIIFTDNTYIRTYDTWYIGVTGRIDW